MHGTEVRALAQERAPRRGGRDGRALADSPTTVAIYGDDPLDGLAGLYARARPVLRTAPVPTVGGVRRRLRRSRRRASPPREGASAPSWAPRRRSSWRHRLPPSASPARAHVFWAHWAQADLAEEHWHLGPVGVEPGFQGRGIGGALDAQRCAPGSTRGPRRAWLETDKERNVRFYAGLGFEVADKATVLDVETWYMRRDPRP